MYIEDFEEYVYEPKVVGTIVVKIKESKLPDIVWDDEECQGVESPTTTN